MLFFFFRARQNPRVYLNFDKKKMSFKDLNINLILKIFEYVDVFVSIGVHDRMSIKSVMGNWSSKKWLSKARLCPKRTSVEEPNQTNALSKLYIRNGRPYTTRSNLFFLLHVVNLSISKTFKNKETNKTKILNQLRNDLKTVQGLMKKTKYLKWKINYCFCHSQCDLKIEEMIHVFDEFNVPYFTPRDKIAYHLRIVSFLCVHNKF